MLGIGIQKTAERIPRKIEPGIQVPLTKNPESSTWNPEYTALNPKSNAVLDFLTWGDLVKQVCW